PLCLPCLCVYCVNTIPGAARNIIGTSTFACSVYDSIFDYRVRLRAEVNLPLQSAGPKWLFCVDEKRQQRNTRNKSDDKSSYAMHFDLLTLENPIRFLCGLYCCGRIV